jgi:hypothetical protein
MRLDQDQVLSDDQNPTAVAATASTNVIDMGAGSMRRFGGAGVMEPLVLFAQVTTAFTSGGAATMSITVQQDNDEAFGSPLTVGVTDAIPVASLVAGYEFESISLAKITERYVRCTYTIATAVMTAGRITTAIVPASFVQRGVGQANL